MPRLRFEKVGTAVWMSHLDLMRVFQRAFKRAGLPLKHTQGFNPRPSVSIALPMSVGVESVCELLDFDLDGVSVPCDDILARLNACLVTGVRGLEVYENGSKLRNLAYLDCQVFLEYDAGIPAGAEAQIDALFRRPTLPMEKHGKNGPQMQDLIPMIRRLSLAADGNTLVLSARVCCQNPTLNPAQLAAAVDEYLPAFRPDFAHCRRLELYDQNETIFR